MIPAVCQELPYLPLLQVRSGSEWNCRQQQSLDFIQFTFNLLNLYDSQILFIVYLINWVHFVGKTLRSWIFINMSCKVFDSIQYKKVLKLLSPIVLHSLVTYICKTFNYCQVFNLHVNLGFFSWLKISKFSLLNVFVISMFPAEYW